MILLVLRDDECTVLADLIELTIEQVKDAKAMSTVDGTITDVDTFVETIGAYDEDIRILENTVRKLRAKTRKKKRGRYFASG